MVKEITQADEKQRIARKVLEALPNWFGIEESREEYISECANLTFFAAYDDKNPIGFIALKETGKDTIEVYVTGILKEYHRKGIGRQLFEEAKADAKKQGYSFIQVKTVKIGIYDEYDKTNLFYRAIGFKEFEVFPTLWDKANPCQVYVMALN